MPGGNKKLQLKPETIFSRAKGASKLSVIIDFNKPFETYQPYFTGDTKHGNGKFDYHSTM